MKKAPEKNKTPQNRISTTLILCVIILFSLQTFIINPLYVYTSSDVVFATTPLPEIIEILGDIVDPIAYALCFSCVVYSIFRFSLSYSKKPIIVLSLSFLLKYLANYIVSSVVEGALTLGDIRFVLISFAFDMVIFAAVCLVACSRIRKYYEERAEIQKANKVLNRRTPSLHEDVFADKKLISLKNPLHFSAFFMGIALSVVKILTRIRFDMIVGAPSSIMDAIWMIVYYISDLLIAILVYAASLLLFSYLEKHMPKDLNIEEISHTL